jgi:hypothetical protein
MLCSFRSIFGDPREGVHSLRFFDFAVVDTVLVLIVAYFISKKHFILWALGLFLLGIAVHRFFCVKTKVDQLIFG